MFWEFFFAVSSHFPLPGYGDQNINFRPVGGFFAADPPSTPGPFSAARNEGTIPGIGAAMPLSMPSIDGSDPGERQPFPSVMPSNAPPLPPGPHPSLLGSNQQPHFQVTSHQQQQQAYPQQMMPLHPQNMPQIQPHMQHHPLHLRQRPPPQGSMPLPPSSLPQTPNLMVFFTLLCSIFLLIFSYSMPREYLIIVTV